MVNKVDSSSDNTNKSKSMAEKAGEARRDLAADVKHVSILGRIGQVWFAVCLVTALLWTWLLVTITTARFSFWDSVDKSGTISLYMTRFSIAVFHWSLWLACALQPQVTINVEGFEQWEKTLTQRPLAILANHLSFMDMIIGCAYVPWYVVLDTKTLFKSSLYNIPIFGAIASACRHIPVYFKADVSGKFSTADDKKAETAKRINDTLAGDQHLIMFPEGTMNRGDISQLQPFRYGTFRALLSQDADLWGLAIHGTEKCWPINAKAGNNTGNIGGLPSTITIRLFEIAPVGCSEFVGGNAKVDKDQSSDKFSKQVETVATKTRDCFQKEIDSFFKKTQ